MRENEFTREKKVHEDHPFLHHYTNLGGLSGMLANHSLWATRYDYLNDSTEIDHLREKLVRAIEPPVLSFLRSFAKKSFKQQRRVEKAGGTAAIARRDAAAMVDVIYQINFKGDKEAAPFAVPYITSFCSHCLDGGYLQKNGLLSQWRAYGGTERYAIVFDTEALSKAMEREDSTFKYSFGQFGDAVYNTDTLDLSERFPTLISLFGDWYATYDLEELDDDTMEELYKAFMNVATRFKHRAFQEEREVRLVLAPLTTELRDYLLRKQGGDDSQGKALKPILYRDRDGGQVPFISLLEEQKRPLPIIKVIVGPSRNMKEAVDRAKDLVRGRIKVEVSDTPFIG